MEFFSLSRFNNFFTAKYRKIFVKSFLLVIILFIGFTVRMNTFWLPHWIGDQSQYVALAMKLDNFGFSNYNIRGVDVGFFDLDPGKTIRIVYPVPTEDAKDEGRMLRALKTVGLDYYDQPFYHKPPGFPYILMLSHKIFAKNRKFYTIVFTNIGEKVRKMKPKPFFEAQFYAVIVPLFFSLGLIAGTFFIGNTLFSYRTGLYAAFMMSIHPIDIMTSNRLLTDDMLSFFLCLSILCCIRAVKVRNPLYMLLSGVLCGAAVLAKQTAGYLVFSLFPFFILTTEKKTWDLKYVISSVFNKFFWIFLIGVFLISGFWFYKVYTIYGDPLYTPAMDNIVGKDITGWFYYLDKRPPGIFIYFMAISYLCPPMIFSLFTLKDAVTNLYRLLAKKAYDYRFILLWCIIVVFLFNLRHHKEHRMILPIYPAFAVLSGLALDRFRLYAGHFAKYMGSRVIREIVICLIFAVSAIWSVKIGYRILFNEMILICIPF